MKRHSIGQLSTGYRYLKSKVLHENEAGLVTLKDKIFEDFTGHPIFNMIFLVDDISKQFMKEENILHTLNLDYVVIFNAVCYDPTYITLEYACFDLKCMEQECNATKRIFKVHCSV